MQTFYYFVATWLFGCMSGAAFAMAEFYARHPVDADKQREVFAICAAEIPKSTPEFGHAIGQCLKASRELSR